MHRRDRPLGQNTDRQYTAILTRAFGRATPPFGAPRGVTAWPDSCRALLRAAVKHAGRIAGVDAASVLALIPPDRRWQKPVIAIPSEREAKAYETAAEQLPAARRALAMIPLAAGLRAAELLGLDRDEVQRAARDGELIFIRKGNVKAKLDVSRCRGLFAALLTAPAARPRGLDTALKARMWRRVGEIVSAGVAKTRYNRLRGIVRGTGTVAGLKGLRPHLLRHAFATRMVRDGAPLPVVQAALGHASMSTTQRYVHPEAADVAKYMRRF